MSRLPLFTTLGAGPTILMLHGIGGGHRAFAPQVETFAASGYRAVAWDMPGYGRSAPVEPYNFKALAQSCIALIDGLRCGTVTLLGHDIGGMVAQEVVARRPELVDRLILCGTASTFGRDADGRVSQALRDEFVTRSVAPLDAGNDMTTLAQTLVPRMVGPAALPEGVQLATHCMAHVNASAYRKAVEAMSTFDRQAALLDIRVPTLLMAGEYDRETPPASMKKMAQDIAGSTYLELKGVGHLQNLESPDDFDGLVLNFLALPRVLH
jgi:3-oxoadipate enol-lactonase